MNQSLCPRTVAGAGAGALVGRSPTNCRTPCEADPELAQLQSLPPSTATLVVLVREMVGHFLDGGDCADGQQGQRLRLMFSSHLHDGEFARMLFEEINEVVRPLSTTGDSPRRRPGRSVAVRAADDRAAAVRAGLLAVVAAVTAGDLAAAVVAVPVRRVDARRMDCRGFHRASVRHCG